MRIKFDKYQGTGNDFIMIDNRSGEIRLQSDKIQFLCDRKFGIGSDGIILIEQNRDTAFSMNFYNPDASQSFCGNGSRCAVRFAQSLGVVGIEGNFSAIDGDHDFKSDIDNVSIKMNDVLGIEKDGDHFILNTGSPHYVIYKNDIHELNITSEAHAIRYGQKFKERGINVNFVKEQDHSIDMRTYERGVEDETLSCGTGVTAAAITFGFKHPEISSLDVMTRGGKLVVSFEQDRSGGFSNIWLSGPAQLVYKGEIELP